MVFKLIERRRRRPVPGVLAAGYSLIALGLVGMVVGSLLIESLTADFRSSLRVSRSAITSVGETVEVVESVALATADSISSISRSAASAAATTETARDGLAGVAEFLDQDLPSDIDGIQAALPGAISAADAVDATLGALTLFGVGYAPDEPFGDSLRRVRDTLQTLPDQIREQGSSVRALVPLADTLAGDVSELASSLDALETRLTEVQRLAASYNTTIEEAEAAVENTDRSLDRTVLLLRVVLGVAAAGSIITGLALISIQRALTTETTPELAEIERVPTS